MYKKILLGITGGIAAYKSVDLCRQLRALDCEVRVVMTPAAKEFVTPLTFQAISGHSVHHDVFDEAAEQAMGHIELAKWADCVLIAPASADFIARVAHGLANDLLSTLCLATPAPLFVAPAMNLQMWKAAATTDNVSLLRQRGVVIIGPDSGQQACGDIGPGRMSEPSAIVDGLKLANTELLTGQHWVITAGPTREPIDPVRFLSNNSSGKMGYAIAQAAQRQGAEVTLISGPVNLSAPSGVQFISVKTAQEMMQAVMHSIKGAQVFVACAAVADYKPLVVAEQKIKKNAEQLTLELTKNPDILQEVAGLKDKPLCIGFAAETENVERFAKDKLKRKKLDVICANNVSKQGIGFDSDDNAITLYFADDTSILLEKQSKTQVANQLVSILSEHFFKV